MLQFRVGPVHSNQTINDQLVETGMGQGGNLSFTGLIYESNAADGMLRIGVVEGKIEIAMDLIFVAINEVIEENVQTLNPWEVSFMHLSADCWRIGVETGGKTVKNA